LDSWGDGVLWYLAFLMSVTCHEAAHAWAAMRGGDSTAYLGGQVSLDPEPHIRRSPFGMLVIPIASIIWIGFPMGFASAPFNLEWAYRHPRRAAWMSLAGPGAHLAIVVLCAIAFQAGAANGVFVSGVSPQFDQLVGALDGGIWPSVAHVLSILFSMNLILFLFNMMPVPPLDGSMAVALLLSDDNARRAQNAMRRPAFAWIGLLLAWNLFGDLFRWVFGFVYRWVLP
jgi:Zn-dependent protease